MFVSVQKSDGIVEFDLVQGFTGLTEVNLGEFIELSIGGSILREVEVEWVGCEIDDMYLEDFDEVLYCSIDQNTLDSVFQIIKSSIDFDVVISDDLRKFFTSVQF